MEVVIRSPTGAEINYNTTVSNARNVINSFVLNVPSELYEIKASERKILLILKES